MTQVFLSHADEDREIEEKIRRSLMREGYTVWSSQRDIEAGVDFNAAINRGIETTDNVVYLLSPDSITSEYCQRELEYALSLNKRIIPLNIGAVDDSALPTDIQSLQYIDLANGLEDEETYQARLGDLLKLLNQDKAYFEEHKISSIPFAHGIDEILCICTWNMLNSLAKGRRQAISLWFVWRIVEFRSKWKARRLISIFEFS